MVRFKDAPKIHVNGLSRTDVPDPSGPRFADDGLRRAGARRRCPAALANAFFDATGVRLRESPMTPSRVRGALKNAGAQAGRRHA